MRSAWPASLGALFVIAVTVSLFVRQDPLVLSPTSYGTLPNAYGALHDLLVLLDVPVERSFDAPGALPPASTVWWIEPDRICAKLAAARETADADVAGAAAEDATAPGSPPDWDLAPWIRGGGTAVVFAAGLAECASARRVDALALPVPRLPAPEAFASEAEEDRDEAEAVPGPRADWPPQEVTGPLAPRTRRLPVPPFATFEDVPDGFAVIASADGAPFALEASLGAGRLVLVADSLFLRNRWLDAGDAAPLAFDWVRAYGVPRLDEREHGLSDTPSTTAYLARSPALPVFGGLAVCGALFGWAGASLPRRRIGEVRPAPPTLRTYVDSLARLYARAGDHAEVFARYREHALVELRRALCLAHDAPIERVREVLGARAGADPADLDALRPGLSVSGPDALQRACAALDRLREAAR